MLEQLLEKQELPFVLLQDFSQNKLTTEAVYYLRTVLRQKSEMEILLGDGVGNIAKVQLFKNNEFLIHEQKKISISKPRLHLVQSLVKKKALEWILQKTAEMGVSSITFFSSDYSQPMTKKDKNERLQKILWNACMQSRNPHLPKLYFNTFSLIENLQNIKEEKSRQQIFWGDWIEPQPYTLSDIDGAQEIYFVNGPEGGWSEKEYLYLKNRFRSIKLSNNVLRVETAAVAALAILFFGQKLSKS